MSARDVNHIMMDLETLGTVPGCVGLSIGACQFHPDRGHISTEFYAVISLEDSLANLLATDPDTEEWWSRQSAEAQAVLHEARHPKARKLADVLEEFNLWQKDIGPKSSLRMWGNGADFDNPILRVMYDCAKVKPYAGSYGGRCYRTVKNLDELFGFDFRFHKLERQGTHHNALDDAKSQAHHLMREVARIRGTILGHEELI